MNPPIDFADIAARTKAAPATEAHEQQDAELVRLHCALVTQGHAVAGIEAEGADLHGVTPESEDLQRRLDAADDVWRRLLHEITATRAQGVAGQRAKAATMLVVLEHRVCKGIGGETLADIASGEVGDPEHRLALSLACDILGEPEQKGD